MFILLAALPLSSQEIHSGSGEPSEGASQPSIQDDSTLYVIVEYKFSVKGRSRPSALLYKLIDHGEFKEGEIITGKAALEKYISDITQIYINQRVLKNNVEVEYSTGDQNEDGAYPVTIMIKVEDSWNIIALPRPYYKNNVFDLTLKARDYNFLGTMNPLRIDLGYNYNEDKRHSFLLGAYSDIPFKAFGYYWNFNFDNAVQYRIDAPFYYRNTTGVSMELPFRETTFYFGFYERFYLNEENTDWTETTVAYGPFQDGPFMSSQFSVSWKIPTGLTVSRFGELTYTPYVSTTINHELPKWPLDYFRRGAFLTLSHSLGFEKIDWHANFREGLSVYMSNSYAYTSSQNIHSVSFNFRGIKHFIASDFFAVSSRFMYQYWYSSDETAEGGYPSEYMRGVADKSIIAYQMFLLNMDFPFRLFLFMPSQWFNNRKLRLFDFEMHASPVVDMAVYYQRNFVKGKTLYYPGNLAATGGMEFVVFPLFMRNLYIRLGFAVNLKEFVTERPLKLPSGENREIYLIMGHFY